MSSPTETCKQAACIREYYVLIWSQWILMLCRTRGKLLFGGNKPCRGEHIQFIFNCKIEKKKKMIAKSGAECLIQRTLHYKH